MEPVLVQNLVDITSGCRTTMNYQQIRVQVLVDSVPDYDIVIAEPVMQLSAYLSPLRR